MDFSLFYFASDERDAGHDRYRMLLDGARFADERGFTAVWTPERHFHPFGAIYPNPAVTAAAVAAVTRRVAVRAGSVVAPLHHPLRIAEEWAMVDNLSGGRAGVSFASGWHAVDFALRPENYQTRRELTVEYAQQVRRLWRGEPMPVTDGVGAATEVRAFPAPVQHDIPIWITSAGGAETFRAAGQIGAGVLTHLLGQNLDDVATKIEAYREAIAERPDADGWPGHVVLMVHTFLGPDDHVRNLVREPLSAYLRSSLGLLLGSQTGTARRIDPSKLRERDIDALVQRAFDRYYDESGLLGTVEKAHHTVERFAKAGVDEVACLIDFGVPADQVMEGLEHLDRLRALTSAETP
ncbi:MupA/Atu3671 family FMN-dependent luciferase-like monooxygenase [Micromonospora sp. DT229]|uniref:MupA/Atu3671 family FMN-dependent luciferase-like monooxygenase n=1 Tax=Micromonospora sp. DT229 TaxID=3393430 RepID=UPI003CF8DFD4